MVRLLKVNTNTQLITPNVSLRLLLWQQTRLFRIRTDPYPANTRRKLNVHETFRRSPGRLLNVLCTFNLRSVSTG